MEKNSAKWVSPKINLIFAMSLAIFPLLVSLMDLIIGEYVPLITLLCFWGIIYTIFIAISFIIAIFKRYLFNFQFKLNFYTIIITILAIFVIISCMINKGNTGYVCLYLCIPLIFICIFSVDKKYLDIVVHSLLITLAICCIMGFIDPLNKFMPGFNPLNYQLSIQLGNPNFSAVVMASASVFVYLKIDKSNIKQFLYYLSLYVIYILFLFMNGSFAPITAVAIIQFFCIIFTSVKEKKFKVKFAILSVIAIVTCFLVDLIPDINAIRTCNYNYFLECVAVVDNIFNTNILNLFGIDHIIGADGWERKELMAESIRQCTSNIHTFFFGSGPGAYNDARPHNILLTIWLDFGIIPTLLCLTLLVGWIIHFCRTKEKKSTTLFLTIIAFLLANIVGSLVFYSAYILVIYIAVFVKKQQYVAENQSTTEKT